jgi:hypothetical protein
MVLFQFRSAWKRFLKIPGTVSEVSLDADITTGMTKLMTGHQELPVHPGNNVLLGARRTQAVRDIRRPVRV